MPIADREMSEKSIRPLSRELGTSRFPQRGPELIAHGTLPGPEELCSTPEWQLALRVASSRALAKSEFLRGFLLYVCEQNLTGKSHEITEQRIGTKVFNRPSGYNPGEDNIVRNYARLLRKRLNEYFAGEGAGEAMRIDIPRGAYVPVFRPMEPASQAAEPKLELVQSTTEGAAVHRPTEISATLSDTGWRKSWLWLIIGVAAGALLSSLVWMMAGSHQAELPHSAAHALWAQIFQKNRNTLIVSADSGLGILENLTGHTVGVEDYANGTYLNDVKGGPGFDPAALNDVRRQRYTSFVALNIASQLIQLPELIPNRTQMRFARGISTEDLRNANAILIGSSHTNPWVSLFDKYLNFKLEYTTQVDRSFIVNRAPQSGEQKVYENSTPAGASRTFGAIDYLPSLDGTGHVLIIQGLNMAATQAAADILFDANTMPSILTRAAMPNGSLQSFELLIETNSIGANAPNARIIATRFYPR